MKNRMPLLPHTKALLANCSHAIGDGQEEAAPMRQPESPQEALEPQECVTAFMLRVEVTQIQRMRDRRHPPACLMSRG